MDSGNNKCDLFPEEVISPPLLQINYVCAKAESSAIIRAYVKLAKSFLNSLELIYPKKAGITKKIVILVNVDSTTD